MKVQRLKLELGLRFRLGYSKRRGFELYECLLHVVKIINIEILRYIYTGI